MPYDTATLNYNWQIWETDAYSLYSGTTAKISVQGAELAVDAVERFMICNHILKGNPAPAADARIFHYDDLLNVRTNCSGLYHNLVPQNARIAAGQVLAEIIDPCTGEILETVYSPADGVVFFRYADMKMDAIMLDMSFVRSAFGENRDVRMIELIIDIADYLHVPVVAEGVETEEQYLVLKAMGCDLVQGYYFSRPVPADDFDQFLLKRAETKAELPHEVKKTYMSISRALTSDFESIYYVDLVTGCYLAFHMGKEGELEIRPAGTDFFGDAREKLLADVCEADLEKVREATGKASLTRWTDRKEPVAILFSRQTAGGPVPYSLQTIKTRGSDDHHIVVGVRPE